MDSNNNNNERPRMKATARNDAIARVTRSRTTTAVPIVGPLYQGMTDSNRFKICLLQDEDQILQFTDTKIMLSLQGRTSEGGNHFFSMLTAALRKQS